MDYAYDKVKYSTESSVNQEIRRKFVGREVIYCVSYFVDNIVKECERYDDFPHIFERLNYDDVIYDELKEVYDEQQDEISYLLDDDLEDYEGPWDELLYEYDMDWQDIKEPQDFLDALHNSERITEFADDRSLEPHRDEVYEHWIVSDYLANLLEEQGEMVERDFFGLTIWGRCTTGQSIYMDGVIGTICFNRGILQGQENSWEGR